MKFDEFARKLNNEIESVQPNVLDKIKSTPVTAENLGCGPLATLVWVKAKKFVIPVIYAICAVFVFLLCFSTISADNVGVSDFTYLNISIGDSQEKSADFDFALDKNGRILKVTLGNSSNVDSDKIEQTVLSTIGMTITDAIVSFCNANGVCKRWRFKRFGVNRKIGRKSNFARNQNSLFCRYRQFIDVGAYKRYNRLENKIAFKIGNKIYDNGRTCQNLVRLICRSAARDFTNKLLKELAPLFFLLT